MATGQATSKYIRTSAQKAGLVLAQIRGDERGARAGDAAVLAQDHRARHREGAAVGDCQRAAEGRSSAATSTGCSWPSASPNQGPSMKRIRPAPMGRAFRVVKRMAHLTVEVAERPVEGGRRRRPTRGRPSAARGRPRPSQGGSD